MEKNNIKAVFLDRMFSNKSMGSIIFDSYVAGYEATKYLINLGHKQIAYISGVDSMFDSVQRKKATWPHFKSLIIRLTMIIYCRDTSRKKAPIMRLSILCISTLKSCRQHF